MNKPESPDQGVSFGLETIAQELRCEQQYLRDGHMARTLIRTPDLRIVVIVLRAGTTMAQHHADVTTSVQNLAGHFRLKLPDRTVDMREGQLLVMGARLSHDVYAEADSTLLLTLGWPASE